ncbi:MAG: metallophosphoesterase family protein [Candidatus Aenigmarchaeota archaeon]|nr:metallophosphoesterase family protein [Candidatus Aenigmarchaeota archaeon]
MRIGVISDTHVHSLEEISDEVIKILKETDLIIHCGDYTGIEVVYGLKKLKDFVGVYGNMDPPTIKKMLPAEKVIEIEGFKVGITHGYYLFGERKLREKFKDTDVTLSGHTHLCKYDLKGNVHYLNPGSATGKFPALYKSVGILEIEKEIKGEIIKIR